ncbi:hypothetical protein [Spirosoma areae]
MERFLTLLVASLCAAPLAYFATYWLIVAMNQDAHGPDARLGAAYLSVWGGFAAVPVGFFLVWFLASRFLLPEHLRLLQIIDVVGIVGWGIVYLNYSGKQPQRLAYADHRAVLEVELRATKAMLAGRSIDSLVSIRYYVGTNFDTPHPDRVREEGDAVILPWETVPYEVTEWGVVVFLKNQPVLFWLDLPRRPEKSTDWSGWGTPVHYQDSAIPDEARQGLTLRYRFRLVPHGQQ